MLPGVGKGSPDWEDWWALLAALVETAEMLSANTPIVPTHSATAPLPALNTSNSRIYFFFKNNKTKQKNNKN